MRDLGLILLTNAATATLLGLAVAWVARRLGRPAAVHALWVVVLLDLLAPPVFEVGLLPSMASLPAPVRVAADPLLDTDLPGASAPALSGAEPLGPSFGVAGWIGALWLVGSAGVLILASVRSRRFARSVHRARPAPAALEARLVELAARAGLGRAPRLCLVRACVGPMLRWHRGQLEILFPLGLLRRLEPLERDALLLHELAHARRHDPWVRVIELAATCLFWWHPLVFWARRSLRRAEEMCCDAWVLRWLPGHGREYARGLLETVEFLAGSRSRLPALASGAGGFHGLEERLTMIVKSHPSPPLARPLRWGLALAAAAVLLAFPIGAGRDAAASQDEAGQLEREMLLLQERQQALAERMAELHATEARALAEREAGMTEVQRAELEQAAQELERELLQHENGRLAEEGNHEEVAQLEQELARRRAELTLVQARDRTAAALDLHRRELEQRRHELESAGRTAEAEAVDLQMAELQGAPVGFDGLLDSLRVALNDLRGLEHQRVEIDRELQRALADVDRSLRELHRSVK